jgi:hypothetical protein
MRSAASQAQGQIAADEAEPSGDEDFFVAEWGSNPLRWKA